VSSGRPVLGILHAASPAHALARERPGTVLVPFSRDAGEDAVVDELTRRWFDADLAAMATAGPRRVPGLDATDMTARIAAILDQVAAP
jgi:hypothetical protein